MKSIDRKLRKFTFNVAVVMFASSFMTFALVFITAACLGIIIQLIPWIAATGVTDIDPLGIIIYALVIALIAVGVRYLILRRLSNISPYRKEPEKKAKAPGKILFLQRILQNRKAGM
ncbi:MAG: hypothetical protein JSV63_03110 [Candidatus Aenigmatarchaeota archaeon]|nr:MAG: hypothetical protein JSV63_03110 [Candidatus Aenigmarchaeota archaeon]